MTRRPDLVDVWPFRVGEAAGLEVLLMRRAPDRVLPGLWQGVSGLIEPDDTIAGAALRELREETGLKEPRIEALYHLDYVAEFVWEPADALMASAHFAVRVVPGVDPQLSHEHDAFRWVSVDDAIGEAVWPGYRESLRRIRDDLGDPDRARWFQLDLEGRRVAPRPG